MLPTITDRSTPIAHWDLSQLQNVLILEYFGVALKLINFHPTYLLMWESFTSAGRKKNRKIPCSKFPKISLKVYVKYSMPNFLSQF